MDASVVVVGAGPAGLAVAACLLRRGVEPLVVDDGAEVGDSWRRRYDRLRLHTPRVQSALPGLSIPRSCGRWVGRDDLVSYLVAYAEHHGIRPAFGVSVARVERDGAEWVLTTGTGVVRASQVVLATGRHRVPVLPPGCRAATSGPRVVHAASYRDSAPFRGRHVLVVGAGNSGAEIAAELAEEGAASVLLAVRTPPMLIPRQLGPVPSTLLGIPQDHLPAHLVDPLNRALLARFRRQLPPGVPAPAAGLAAQVRATGSPPTIDAGLVEQLRSGRVRVVAALTAIDDDGVVLADGSRVWPDLVVAATGYTTGLGPVVGHLGVLDARDRPLVGGRRTHPAAPGLRFVGFTAGLKGALLQINLEARASAAAVTRELRRPSSPR